MRNSDLTPLALELAQWGVKDASALEWLDSPPPGALAEGQKLLQKLGALDRQGFITPHGRSMAALPAHPRLSHMLLIAQSRGYGSSACDLTALLAERDIYRTTKKIVVKQTCSSDLLDRLEFLAEWRKNGGAMAASGEVDIYLLRSVDRASRDFQRLIGVKETEQIPSDEEIGLLLAIAFPERIARQREPGSDRYVLANGRGGRLSNRSGVRNRTFIVAVVMEGGDRGDGMIHMASSLTLETLRREFGPCIVQRRLVTWDAGEGRVVSREEERFEELIISSRQIAPDREELQAALIEGLRHGPGLAALGWTNNATQFRARVEFLGRLFPNEGWPDFSDEALLAALPAWIGPFLGSARSLQDLGAIDPLQPLKMLLNREQALRLDEGAPTHLAVQSGSRISVQYNVDGPPVLAVKLQELFGLSESPTVAWGRVPILLHLLSPAGRPIQVTSDLQSFWDKVYPEVKKELKGRYPRHPWPDDPWSATPTRHAKKRGQEKNGTKNKITNPK
jgi:ATP-dependent helicase HrpB